jgi:pimeloyl-ACP methyl ester carboxylesterase
MVLTFNSSIRQFVDPNARSTRNPFRSKTLEAHSIATSTKCTNSISGGWGYLSQCVQSNGMSKLASVDVLGNTMHYYEHGSGPTLVLIHGMFGDHTDWEPTLASLSRNYRVIAPDLPGFGLSDKPDVDYNADFFLRSLQGFLAAVNATPATLIGNSFGGELAILYTLQHPADLNALVLVSSGGLRPFSEQERRQIAIRFSEPILAKLTPQIHEWIFAPIFARHTADRERYISKQNAKLERADRPAYARALFRSMQLAAELDLMDRLPEIACRTLLVWGDADPVFPLTIAQSALERLQSAELVIVPQASHALQLDAPAEFVDAVLRFLGHSENRALGTTQ